MSTTSTSTTTNSGTSMRDQIAGKMPNLSTGQKVAAAGFSLAAAALAAFRTYRAQTTATETTINLEPAENGWKVTMEGKVDTEAHFETKKEALEAARELAHDVAPSELVVYTSEGKEQTRHQYEAE